MRSLAAAIVCIILLSSCALAEIPCSCAQDQCVCFIQQGDEGMAVEVIQNALVSLGFLALKDDAAVFDEATKQAVMAFQKNAGLEVTGMMDDNTMTLLLWGMLPDALDEAQPESGSLPMWIPTDGGIRHHDKPDCSGMLDPRLVSQRNAIAMGFGHCGRCKPYGYVKK